MKISNIAPYFDRDKIADAYTGEFLFMGYTTPHDDHTSSGATARRRTLVTKVDTVPPARRVINWYGTFWLVGNSNTDGFMGEEVRRSFGLKLSTGLMSMLTPAQACLGAQGTPFHAHKEFYRDMTDALSSADMDVMWNIFCPSSEPIVKGTFLRQGGTVFRVRNTYPTVDEYLLAETDQFDADAVQAAVFTSNGGLDLVTDTMTPITIATTVIQTDVPKYYQFRTESEADPKPGDRTVFVAKSALTPVVSSTFTMLGLTWRVVTVVSENDAWALRARIE